MVDLEKEIKELKMDGAVGSILWGIINLIIFIIMHFQMAPILQTMAFFIVSYTLFIAGIIKWQIAETLDKLLTLIKEGGGK